MSVIRSILFLLFLSVPVTGAAGVDELPGDVVWYLHADLHQMRNTESGRSLYEWVDGEVVIEVENKINIDLNKEVDSITAFSASTNGTVIIIEGLMSSDAQDKILGLARLDADVSDKKHGKKAYYYVNDFDDDHAHHKSGEPFEDLEDGAYLSFAVKGKMIVTGNEAQMTELLDNNGKVTGADSHEGALFVLTADKSFVQAGLSTEGMVDDDDDWDSNIIRNTKQAALMVSDFDGMISIEAQLVSTDAKMAQAIGGIANGLIAMQAFNSELDAGIQGLISNTRIMVQDNVLSIKTVIAPDLVADILDD